MTSRRIGRTKDDMEVGGEVDRRRVSASRRRWCAARRCEEARKALLTGLAETRRPFLRLRFS